MDQQLPAIFENGVLRPLVPLDLPEQSQVSIVVRADETATAPFDLKKQQDALDEMFREIQKIPQTPVNDGLSNRDHDHIIYGSIK